MTETKILNKRKETDNKVQHGYKNVLKCSHEPAEKSRHRLAKFRIAEFCWKFGLHFYTEATLNSKGRADVVVLDWGIALEVLQSEGIKGYIKKAEGYEMPAVPVSATLKEEQLNDMLMDLLATNGAGADYYIRKFGEANG